MSSPIQVTIYDFSPLDEDALQYEFSTEEELQEALPHLQALRKRGLRGPLAEKGMDAVDQSAPLWP